MYRKLFRAALAGSAFMAMAHSAAADITAYRFELLDTTVKQGEAVIAVRLVHVPSNRPIPDAVIFAQRLDMGPDKMETMTSPVKPVSSTDAGIYRFKASPSMEGNWALSLAAKVQGETGTRRDQLILKVLP